MNLLDKNRPCGDCRACCTALGVFEISKAPGVPCGHLCKVGCGIYNERPDDCRTYRCLWKAGLGDPLRDRPDKCGVILDVADNGVAYVRELFDGASELQHNLKTVEHLAGRLIVVTVRKDGTLSGRVRGPEPVMQKVLSRSAGHGHNP